LDCNLIRTVLNSLSMMTDAIKGERANSTRQMNGET
jgi:hypothetical protein